MKREIDVEPEGRLHYLNLMTTDHASALSGQCSRSGRLLSSITCTLMVLIALFAAVFAAVDCVAQDRDSSVLKFYWDRARGSLHSRDPLEHGVAYSFEATTVYKKIGKLGEITSTDSLRTTYFYSFGKMDSSKIILSSAHSVPRIDLSYPIVFDSTYVLNFYPNDTGGALIAVGFETDSTHPEWPVGLAMLDRARYFPRWLYLSYPKKSGYRSFSRSVRFTEREGYVFPDSVSEIGVIDGLISTTRYRLETRIGNLQVRR